MGWNEIFLLDASDPLFSFDATYVSSSPTPEDGARLLRAFLSIGQPALREAIIKLVARVSEADKPSSRAQRTV
jgi:hypothetical protein